MKAKIIIALVVILAIAGIAYYTHKNPAVTLPAVSTVSGTVKYVATSAGTITLQTTDGNEMTLALDPMTKFYDESGAEISLTDIQTGMSVQATGTTTPTAIIPGQVKIVSRPPTGTDIAGPCPGIVDEGNNSISCSMSTTSRITISLPAAHYTKGNLSITPKDSMGETFGASTQDDRWVRTFEAVNPGTVTINVPSNDKSTTAFKITIDVFGQPEHPADTSASGSTDVNGSDTSGTDTLNQQQ
jgi:hypothetical protein